MADETGCNLHNATKKYVDGVKGMSPQNYTLKLRGKQKHYSAVGILTAEGVEGVYIEEDNREMFLDVIRKCRIPILMPFDETNQSSYWTVCWSVMWTGVVDTIQCVGALVRFLPKYSPDMNPVEEAFTEIKQYLRANDSLFRATSCPRTVILMAIASVTVHNCESYIRHASYKN